MEVSLLSLSTNPSDHECQEGDLSTMLNLVNEDGALQPITAPAELTTIEFRSSGFDLDAADAKIYVHETDTDDANSSDHTNWLAVFTDKNTAANNRLLWCDDIYADAPVWKELTSLKGFKVNAITFTGRIVNLVGDTEQRWCLWKGDSYQVVNYSDFKYSLSLHTKFDGLETLEVDYGDDFSGIVTMAGDSEFGKEGAGVDGISASGMLAIADALTAKMNKVCEDEEYLHNHTSFGFAAIRLYDGQNIMLSNLFTCADNDITDYYLEFLKYNLSVKAYIGRRTHSIAVSMPKLDELSSLIQGVDIYVSTDSFFKKIKKKYTFGTVYPWKESVKDFNQEVRVPLDNLDEKELYDEFDSLTFHRVAFISREEIAGSVAAPIKFKKADESDSSMTLADFYRSLHGANTAINYNSRLNIADVQDTLELDGYPEVSYVWDYDIENSLDYLSVNDTTIPVTTSQNKTLITSEFIIKIEYADTFGATHTAWRKHSGVVPLPPVLMFPVENVSSIDIFFLYQSGSDNYWFKKGLKLHTSALGGFSYYLFTPNGTPSFQSQYNINWVSSTEHTWVDNGFFSSADGETEWNAAYVKQAAGSHNITHRYRNYIYCSQSDNPFLFKQANTISVGNGSVLALAAPTQPISQGQAGQTPLVAFTTEGIWPLYVNDDGSLDVTQPGPRDVLIQDANGNYNTDAITPIDDAILFITDRGIMMYAGSSTQCISDSLRGLLNDVTLPHLSDILAAAGQEDIEEDANDLGSYLYMGTFESYLQDARMIYDYADQRIIVYSPVSTFAFVLSLRSKAWGLMQCNFNQTLNVYPGSQALYVEATENVVPIAETSADEEEEEEEEETADAYVYIYPNMATNFTGGYVTAINNTWLYGTKALPSLNSDGYYNTPYVQTNARTRILVLVPEAYAITGISYRYYNTVNDAWTTYKDKLSCVCKATCPMRNGSGDYYLYSFDADVLTAEWSFKLTEYDESAGQRRAPKKTTETMNLLHLVDLHNPIPAASKVYAITRPLGLGSPDVLKRVASSIIRGLFAKGELKSAVYGSRDLQNWFLLDTSVDHYLRGRLGSPYKYFRYVIAGELNPGESVQGISVDASQSLANQLR